MTTAVPKSTPAQRLMLLMRGLPLWVKQVIYINLRQELADHFVADSLDDLSFEDTIAFYIPKITKTGEQNLMEIKDDVGKLLLDARQQLTLLDICLKNNWSLETCCIQLMSAIDCNYVFTPSSSKAYGTIGYLANRFRLGEYLVKMGRISTDQLEQALRTQQYIKEALQEHNGLANILINLGTITRRDTEWILFLKEESKKPIEAASILEKFAKLGL